MMSVSCRLLKREAIRSSLKVSDSCRLLKREVIRSSLKVSDSFPWLKREAICSSLKVSDSFRLLQSTLPTRRAIFSLIKEDSASLFQEMWICSWISGKNHQSYICEESSMRLMRCMFLCAGSESWKAATDWSSYQASERRGLWGSLWGLWRRDQSWHAYVG